ncbi:MAG: hypothetical protein ABI841_07945 [Chloroflexota bacterium]
MSTRSRARNLQRALASARVGRTHRFVRPSDRLALTLPSAWVVDGFLRLMGGRPSGLGRAELAVLATVEPGGRPDVEEALLAEARGEWPMAEDTKNEEDEAHDE